MPGLRGELNPDAITPPPSAFDRQMTDVAPALASQIGVSAEERQRLEEQRRLNEPISPAALSFVRHLHAEGVLRRKYPGTAQVTPEQAQAAMDEAEKDIRYLTRQDYADLIPYLTKVYGEQTRQETTQRAIGYGQFRPNAAETKPLPTVEQLLKAAPIPPGTKTDPIDIEAARAMGALQGIDPRAAPGQYPTLENARGFLTAYQNHLTKGDAPAFLEMVLADPGKSQAGPQALALARKFHKDYKDSGWLGLFKKAPGAPVMAPPGASGG